MADYYNLQQLSQRAKVSETEIRQLQEAGFLSPITKNGRLFFSSQGIERTFGAQGRLYQSGRTVASGQTRAAASISTLPDDRVSNWEMTC